MKSNTNLRIVENNSHASKNFTIQASGKMFHMVISGLYSNKPQSITREIWSNAYDAHAMVGKEGVPFNVTFPTALTPVFSCRDFGPGIAHEDMEGFYTVLGHSTKEDTNKAVGKWGVGRMSPMSYTDTFSVVSRHKGMIAYYSVQLGPDGSPELHVLAPPSPTGEQDGLEVSFPVRREDINAFQSAAEVVSYGFTVAPQVSNSKDKQFSPVKKVFEGKDFYLYEDQRLHGAYAQMGCVLYPIPSLYFKRTMNIVYQFDIGDLEVTASRESLSFGPMDSTASNIKLKSAVVEDQIVDLMQKQVDAQPRMFDAAKIVPKLRKFLGRHDKSFTYKGLPIPTTWDMPIHKDVEVCAGYMSYRQKIAGWSLERTLELTQEYTIFVEDLSDKKANARVATRIGAALGNHTRFIWIKANLSNAVSRAGVDALIQEVGYVVKYVKDLPDPGPRKSTRAKVSVSRVSNNRQEKFEMDDADFLAGGYYYPMSNNDYPAILNTLRGLVKTALGEEEIILVPKTLWKKFEGNSKWKLLMPALEALVKLNHKKVVDLFSNRYDISPINTLAGFDTTFDNPIRDFARKIKGPQPNEYLGANRQVWGSLLNFYKLTTYHNDGSLKEYNQLLDKYPLMKLYDQYSHTTYKKHFADYMNLIDNKAKE